MKLQILKSYRYSTIIRSILLCLFVALWLIPEIE
jgi:hypothetical protein